MSSILPDNWCPACGGKGALETERPDAQVICERCGGTGKRANLTKNEIKKELYKQKPIAKVDCSSDESYRFVASIVVGGDRSNKKLLSFTVPKKEADGVFNSQEPAQLLIRWLDD